MWKRISYHYVATAINKFILARVVDMLRKIYAERKDVLKKTETDIIRGFDSFLQDGR